MALFKGSSGKISIKGKEASGTEKFLAHTTSWDIESSTDIDETAYFGGSKTEEGVKEKTPGTIGWTGTIEGAVDLSDGSNQDDLLEAHNAQSIITGMFYLDATTAYTGDAYIESLSISHAADGKAEFSASLSGNGKIKKVTVQ